jgi:hypothetical protein
MITDVEIPNIVNVNSIRFVETFRNIKNVITCMVCKPKSFKPGKSCYSNSMDLKGLDLSWFPFKEPIGCLMSVGVHTSTT